MLNIKNLWKNKQVEKSTNNPTTCKKHLHLKDTRGKIRHSLILSANQLRSKL